MTYPVAALIYALVTAALFAHLLPDVSTHLFSDLGDPLLNTAILAWNARHVPLTEAWWNFPSFAPLSGVTAFTEHLLAAYPIASPVIWMTGNPVLAYNVVFLLALPLNASAAYALARELSASSSAAFVAGLAFACAPYQSAHLSHLQMMLAFGMPIGLLGLHRYVVTRKRGGLALLAAGWLMTALANAYVLVFFPLLVALWCVWFVRPREWRRLIAPAVTALVATLPVAPLLWGYHVRQAAYGLTREYKEIQSFGADLVGVAGMYHRAVPWRGLLPHDFEEGALFPGFTIVTLAAIAVVVALTRRTDAEPDAGAETPALQEGTCRAQALACANAADAATAAGTAANTVGAHAAAAWARRLRLAAAALTLVVLARIWTGPWGWHFGPIPLPPFRPYRLFTVASALFLAGIVASGRFRRAWMRRDAVVFSAVAAVALWLVSLGPEPEWSTPWRALSYGPYRLLMELPGLQSIRVPARAWLPAVLCLAMLAGFGTLVLIRRCPVRQRALVTAIAALIVAEGWFFDGTMEAPRPMREGAIPRGALVLDLPMDEGYWNAVPLYRAVVGGYRTINGYSGYEPRHFNPLRHAIADLRSDALEPYRRLADLYVILRPGEHPVVARWVATQPGAEHLFDTGDGRIYRLPRLEAPAQTGPMPLPLPVPGGRPFGAP